MMRKSKYIETFLEIWILGGSRQNKIKIIKY